MNDARYPPTQHDYIAGVQRQHRDRHRRSCLGAGMCQMCGRKAHKGKCEEEEERLPCPPLKVQALKLRLIFAGEGRPSFTMQDDD